MTDGIKADAPAGEPVAKSAKKAAAKRRSARAKVARAPKKAAVAYLNTAEGQKLLDQAIEAKFATLVDRFNVTAGQPQAAEGDIDAGTLKLLRGLAAAIGEVGDQNAKIKRVPPEELEARLQARQEMEGVIVSILAEGLEYPRYDLTRDVYLDEQLVYATYINRDHVRCVQQVDWPGCPDESMRPVNEMAKKVYALFIRSIGARTKEAKVAYTRAADRPGLRVIGAADARPMAVPPVGSVRGSNAGLSVLRPAAQGEVKQLNVLGTIAAPARQIG